MKRQRGNYKKSKNYKGHNKHKNESKKISTNSSTVTLQNKNLLLKNDLELTTLSNTKPTTYVSTTSTVTWSDIHIFLNSRLTTLKCHMKETSKFLARILAKIIWVALIVFLIWVTVVYSKKCIKQKSKLQQCQTKINTVLSAEPELIVSETKKSLYKDLSLDYTYTNLCSVETIYNLVKHSSFSGSKEITHILKKCNDICSEEILYYYDETYTGSHYSDKDLKRVFEICNEALNCNHLDFENKLKQLDDELSQIQATHKK